MAFSQVEKNIETALRETTRRQANASDPDASVWVRANAGTGKTHVLTMRTLRLMLSGTPPERILCLTYTKAAAAEMSARVFGALATWVTAGTSDLKAKLEELLMRPADDAEILRARTLFAQAIETPGGLKVQTIHAFCERMLQRFPLEAGVSPGFAILDDDMVATLQREAIDGVLRTATRDPEQALGRALSTAIAHASDDRFDDVLASALRNRGFIEDAVRFLGDGPDGARSYAGMDDLLRDTLNVRRGAKTDDIEAEMCFVLDSGTLSRLRDALGSGSTTDVKSSVVLGQVIGAPAGPARIDALARFFLTGKGEPRKTLMTKATREAHPDLGEKAASAQGRFHALSIERACLVAIEATLALIALSDAVLQGYNDGKARRAGLDYEDLIVKTVNLLATSENADWVLFKLDGGLDHILVDESQDTSPAQWKIVEALADEFFSGLGAREDKRTLFAVGDEKQSIYSFQGAAPEQFSQMGSRFGALAEDAGETWRKVPLNVSFRTVPAILEAVDAVFEDSARTPGLSGEPDALSHVAARVGRGGLVEIWPSETTSESQTSDVWLPVVEAEGPTPASVLAMRVARTVRGWLDSGERLESEDRPIRPSDILILVRKRNPFAGPMVAALKALEIPVAGADRVDLNQQIAVLDLIALGDFLTLPEDDLALACVLKSPMFGFDDDDLFRIAHERKGTLWKALLDARGLGDRFEAAATTLLGWRKRADFLPPYEFFAEILDKGGMRSRMLARLGGEAGEPLDEFLNLTISYDESAPPSLSGFLAWLRSGKREIKRDMEQGANVVRVMTVHGSKGLEAPIVFLPDTCTTASGGGNTDALISLDAAVLPDGMSDLMVWKIKGAGKIDAVREAANRQKSADQKELNRLLYVAMTRARDRLYVCGFEGARGRAPGCWYDLISEGMGRLLKDATDGEGRPVRRYTCEQTHGTPDQPKQDHGDEYASETRPGWALVPAASERQLSVPLAPSSLAPYDTDDEGEPVDVSGGGGGATEPERGPEMPITSPVIEPDDGIRFLRGTITHALLEHLPGLPSESWEVAAGKYAEVRGAELSEQARASLVKESLAILRHREFAPLFGSKSQAEVPIAADIPPPPGRTAPMRLTGIIDRLVELDHEILIVDYKTNRVPPRTVADVAEAYLYQLSAYRLALLEIYPGKRLRAAILWTQSADLMEIPAEVLEKFSKQLWELDILAS